ncbi:MAG: hypothetical protein PWQ30_754 [Euryarchaeota archaeon]|nr:hypothetical protein [Euryarchaeota archaeon]
MAASSPGPQLERMVAAGSSSSLTGITFPMDAKSPSTRRASCLPTRPPWQMSVVPCPAAEVIVGTARVTAPEKIPSISARPMPAASETMCSPPSITGTISRRTSIVSCGLTARTIVRHRRARSVFVPVMPMPGHAAAHASRLSRLLAVTTTSSMPSTPDERNPSTSMLPMCP